MEVTDAQIMGLLLLIADLSLQVRQQDLVITALRNELEKNGSQKENP